MSSASDSLLNIVPVVVTGGVALAFMNKFLGQQTPKSSRKRKVFDRQERKDNGLRGPKFGNFSNVGF